MPCLDVAAYFQPVQKTPNSLVNTLFMSKYHPIDVRYQGPSTAYTGSLNKRQIDPPAPAPQPVDIPRSADQTAKAAANPWGAEQRATSAPLPPPKPRPAPRRAGSTAMPLAWRLLVPWPVQMVVGLFRRLGWAWSIALLYILGTVLF